MRLAISRRVFLVFTLFSTQACSDRIFYADFNGDQNGQPATASIGTITMATGPAMQAVAQPPGLLTTIDGTSAWIWAGDDPSLNQRVRFTSVNVASQNSRKIIEWNGKRGLTEESLECAVMGTPTSSGPVVGMRFWLTKDHIITSDHKNELVYAGAFHTQSAAPPPQDLPVHTIRIRYDPTDDTYRLTVQQGGPGMVTHADDVITANAAQFRSASRLRVECGFVFVSSLIPFGFNNFYMFENVKMIEQDD